MNKTGVIIAVVVLLVLGGGAFALMQNSDPKTSTTTTSATTESTPTVDDTTTTESSQQTASPDTSDAATITYGNDGFSPASITVKAGTTVTIKNTSSRPLQFASDPHPVHTDNQELNESTISPGKTGSITVSKKGTNGYHNHLNEDHEGKIIVE